MAFTVSNALVETFDNLGLLKVSKATGGSTTTIVDTAQTGQIGADDTWNGGWAVVIRDSAGASAAPENEFAKITDWVDSTGTFTIDTITSAAGSGDIYGIVRPQYPLQQVIRRLNSTLLELGNVKKVDTSISTLASQLEYTLPVALKHNEPFMVQIQGTTADSNANRWVKLDNWYVTPAAAGSTGLLVLREQPPVGYTLKLWYMDRHAYVSAFGDVIDEGFDPMLVTRMFEHKIASWNLAKDGYADEDLMRGWNLTKQVAEQAKTENPPYRAKRKSKLLVLNEFASSTEDDDFSYPAAP